jgi:hypothetical protein
MRGTYSLHEYGVGRAVVILVALYFGIFRESFIFTLMLVLIPTLPLSFLLLMHNPSSSVRRLSYFRSLILVVLFSEDPSAFAHAAVGHIEQGRSHTVSEVTHWVSAANRSASLLRSPTITTVTPTQ